MDNKGTALIITLVYVIIIAILCTSILAFGAQHYQLVSQRSARTENIFYADGGLYAGLEGTRGSITIGSETVDITVVNISGTDYLESKSVY